MADTDLTPERRTALARKGEWLYARQCAKAGGVSCIEGFVEHQIRLGRIGVVSDLLELLRGRLNAPQTAEDGDLRAKTKALIDRLETRLADR
jgi:hypothetical protein